MIQWFDVIEEVGWVDVFCYLEGLKREYMWYFLNKGNGFWFDQVFVSFKFCDFFRIVMYVWVGVFDIFEWWVEFSDYVVLLVDLDLC